MTRDELEFQISQYLDGTLAAAQATALELRLATDAEARALLDEYRRLDVALKSAPVPSINWDRFGDQVCAAVAEQEEAPAVTYRIGWYRRAATFALAASVLIAIGFGIRALRPNPSEPGGPGAVARTPVQITVVDATTGTTGAAPVTAPVAPSAEIEVAVGPSKSFQDQPSSAGYHDDLIARPSQVIIARSGQYPHDTAPLP